MILIIEYFGNIDLDVSLWHTQCFIKDWKWKQTNAKIKDLEIVSDHYCAFECDQHPNGCTHWANNGNKCLLYFGFINTPSPQLKDNQKLSGKNVHVGTRLCRDSNTIQLYKSTQIESFKSNNIYELCRYLFFFYSHNIKRTRIS